jgi:hypothetical protein
MGGIVQANSDVASIVRDEPMDVASRALIVRSSWLEYPSIPWYPAPPSSQTDALGALKNKRAFELTFWMRMGLKNLYRTFHLSASVYIACEPPIRQVERHPSESIGSALSGALRLALRCREIPYTRLRPVENSGCSFLSTFQSVYRSFVFRSETLKHFVHAVM